MLVSVAVQSSIPFDKRKFRNTLLYFKGADNTTFVFDLDKYLYLIEKAIDQAVNAMDLIVAAMQPAFKKLYEGIGEFIKEFANVLTPGNKQTEIQRFVESNYPVLYHDHLRKWPVGQSWQRNFGRPFHLRISNDNKGIRNFTKGKR